MLTESGPLVVTQDGAEIQKLRITSTSGAALRIEGAANVTVRDVEIFHAARDNHCAGQGGRDAPLSNSLVWAGSPDSEHLKVKNSAYL